MTRGIQRLVSAFGFLGNTRNRSRRNIAAHYDLSNDFFGTFLDDTMTYSAAVFRRPDATLEEAQTEKLDRLCRKLALAPEHHVVEIGCGWGSFALHAARHYGCRVTATTISGEQARLARQRVADAGLVGRIEIVETDYRDLKGAFDRAVSIEMIEAIGADQYETYFRKIADLLRPDGLAAIQAITVSDRHFERARREVDFIKRYVFPGCCIPALSPMATAAGRAALDVVDVEDIGMHYAETLRRWRHRFTARRTEVTSLGFDARFQRLWEFYLAYCEAGFRERRLRDLQLVLAAAGNRSFANGVAGERAPGRSERTHSGRAAGVPVQTGAAR